MHIKALNNEMSKILENMEEIEQAREEYELFLEEEIDLSALNTLSSLLRDIEEDTIADYLDKVIDFISNT